VLARNDRPWRGTAPPAVVHRYAPGRGGEHAIALLRGYTGVLQTDAYAAYGKLADPKRVGGPVTLAYYWAHWRRQAPWRFAGKSRAGAEQGPGGSARAFWILHSADKPIRCNSDGNGVISARGCCSQSREEIAHLPCAHDYQLHPITL
jgi:hypothetical protein